MNKEAISALIGWSVACLVAIVLFFVGWNYLFSEPVNTEGGAGTQQQNSPAVSGQDAVWGEYTDTDLVIFRSVYKNTPGYAAKVINATGRLRDATANEYIRHTSCDDFLRERMEILIMLNKISYNGKDRVRYRADAQTQIPALKNCFACSGKLVVPCTKCKGKKNQKQITFRGTGSLMDSARSSSDCRSCKNSGEEFCPSCKKLIQEFAKEELQKIRPYCEDKLEKIETEQNRRREEEKKQAS